MNQPCRAQADFPWYSLVYNTHWSNVICNRSGGRDMWGWTQAKLLCSQKFPPGEIKFFAASFGNCWDINFIHKSYIRTCRYAMQEPFSIFFFFAKFLKEVRYFMIFLYMLKLLYLFLLFNLALILQSVVPCPTCISINA